MAALLRLVAIGHKSFWLDEIASVVIAHMPGKSFWSWIWHNEGNMALYYILLRGWLYLGVGEGRVRVLSAIPGILCIPLIYVLGKRLLGPSVGIVSALLLTVNACAVVYSQEARAYSFLVLGVIISTLLFVGLNEQPSYRNAVLYALAAGTTLYFHYFGLLVVAGHAVSLLALPRDRRSWKHLSAAFAVLVALSLPVLWMIHIQPIGHLDWVPKPSFLEAYHLGVFLAAESGKGVGVVLLIFDLALVLLFFRAALVSWKQSSAGLSNWRYVLVISGFVTPILASLLLSTVHPVFFHRFLIICLPSWIIMMAAGAEQLGNQRSRMFVITGVCLLSLSSTILSYTRVREDWRGVASYLIANARSSDVVLYYQPMGYFAAENYRSWLPGGEANRPMPVMVEPSSEAWKRSVGKGRRVWLVTYPAPLEDSTERDITAALKQLFSVGEKRDFRAISVTEYGSGQQP